MAYYVRGLQDASQLRNNINKIEKQDELENVLEQFFSQYKS